MLEFGCSRNHGGHISFFVSEGIIIVIVYIDEIVVTSDDQDEVKPLESYLRCNMILRLRGC